MNITELLMKTVDTDITKICVNITTIDDFYSLCYIEYEDSYKLGIYITAEDMTERFIILYKTHIVSISVVYAEDLQKPEEKVDHMFI